jgi:protein-tyrosine phosphatase
MTERSVVPSIGHFGLVIGHFSPYTIAMIEYSVLFVCTGNTCRSPMAEGLARHILAQLKGVPESQLEAAGVRVRSAGVATGGGSGATPEAIQALAEVSVDIAGHASQPLTADLIQDADAIYTMTDRHRDAVLMYAPQAAEKTHRLLADRDVADPIGGPLELYTQTAEMIREGVRARIAERYADAPR